tara:strand:- start:285 stop:479 length:195 start_codon:yes stop_codon:yes gene_type:complete
MNDYMIARLKKLAKQECYFDDEDKDQIVEDYVGGNVDDAFEVGERAGETILARDVLTAMNIDWS